MKRQMTTVILAMAGAALLADVAHPCTVAVVSGRATPDGRPLLWKNRDSGHEANAVMAFAGSRYTFLGVVNGDDEEGTAVWAGANSAGFAIMNSASYNLYSDDERQQPDFRRDEEGVLMKQALATCATVDDFERLLVETENRHGIEANFGVIDAAGGAAFFETTHDRFVRFNASDPTVSPEGYILRTNYSFSGHPNQGAGYIRFDRATLLFRHGVSSAGLSLDWLLTTASRDMTNSLTGYDPLAGALPAHDRDQRFVHARDTIVRHTACSTSVIQGVAAGEDPGGTILWVRLGHPLTSVAIPHWVAAGAPPALTAGPGTPPLDRFSLAQRARVFPLSGGSRGEYLDLAVVINRRKDGLLAHLVAIEEEVIAQTAQRVSSSKDTPIADIQRAIAEAAAARLCEAYPDPCRAANLTVNVHQLGGEATRPSG